MTKEKIGNVMTGIFGSLMLAGITGVAVDVVLAWSGIPVPCSLFLLGILGMAALLFLLFGRNPSRLIKLVMGILATVCVLGLCLFLCWFSFSKNAAYAAVDEGKTALYADKKVMLIVPHQDDDINVLGGVMEEYVRYGSAFYPVFVTNGDQVGLAEERFRETVEVFRQIGVPEENIVFLGYGDTWEEGGPHLYNAPEGVTVTSFVGKTETYGTQSHGVWREGRAYTAENLMEDLKDVILTFRPDEIYCSDYDRHIDHKATTLFFEKVMGNILKENPDYRPQVFKGYAYNTAWYAQPDFYEQNILSTQNVFADPYHQTPAVYRWEDRVRLPVGDDTLSRSLFTSDTYQKLALYTSQEAHFHAAQIINGDKVVWFRDTNSLCYDAEITVDSGNGALLNDFMLIDNYDLVDTTRQPLDGVWIPEGEEGTVTVTFPEKRDVEQIVLYDNPSLTDNILEAVIVFADGTQYRSGPLDKGGAATVIPTTQTAVSGFTVRLEKTEGERPGLSELEAYSATPDHGLAYLKLMDTDGNFIYDYWVPNGAEAYLSVYEMGLTEEQNERLELSWDNQKCWAEFENGKIWVICPEGKTMTLTLSVAGEDLSDTVRIHNPGKLQRLWCTVSQGLEEGVFQMYCDGAHRNSATYKLLTTAIDLVR